MRIKFAISLLTAAFLSAGCVIDAATITGKISDTQGNVVSGVKVKLFKMNWQDTSKPVLEQETTADGQGRYKLKSVVIGDRECYTIVAFEKDKWLGGSTVCDEVGIPNDLEITVSHPRTIAGSVRDLAKAPLAGVKVEVQSLSEENFDSEYSGYLSGVVLELTGIAPTITDENGCYRLSGIPEHMSPGVRLSKGGYAMQADDYNGNKFSADMTMIPGGSVKGRIVDKSGHGVGGLRVFGYQPDRFSAESNAVTGPDGSFILNGLISGRVDIRIGVAEKTDLWDFTRKAEAETGETVDLKSIAIPQRTTISGRVIDSKTKKPLAGAKVYISSELYSCSPVASDKNGRFVLKSVPGAVSIGYAGGLSMYAVQRRGPEIKITVPVVGLKDNIVKLERMSMAQGKVVDANGKPVEGIRVSIKMFWEGGRQSVTTDKSGRFSLPVPSLQNQYDGRFGSDDSIPLQAQSADGSIGSLTNISRKVFLKKGAILRVMPATTFDLTVKDSTGKPVERANLTAYYRCGNTSWGVASCRTDANGAATMKKLFPGMKLCVSAAQDGFETGPISGSDNTIVVSADKSKNRKEIILDAAQYISGKIFDVDGKPAAGVRIYRQYGYGQITSDDNGDFKIGTDSLSGGIDEAVTFFASSSDGKSGILESVDPLKIAENGVVLRLRPSKSLTVSVRDKKGNILKGAKVSLSLYRDYDGRHQRSARTSDNGEATLTNLYVGAQYSLAVTYPHYYCETKSLTRVGLPTWTDQVDVKMEPANRVQTGKVIDASGRPVAGAAVSAAVASDTGDSVRTMTDSKGRFTLKGLPNSSIGLSVERNHSWETREVSSATPYVVIKLR